MEIGGLVADGCFANGNGNLDFPVLVAFLLLKKLSAINAKQVVNPKFVNNPDHVRGSCSPKYTERTCITV